MSARLEAAGLTVRYPGVVALDGADLRLHSGEVHGLVGDNGSGKTTLVRALCGFVAPDGGTVRLDGQPVRFRSPRQAARAGIGLVPQDLLLAGALTVAENVVLGAEPANILDRHRMAGDLARLAERTGIEVEPHAVVDDLTGGERQRVAILRALHRGARVLILDEPTASLLPSEAAEVLRLVRELAAHGTAVLLVDHHLDEVAAVADTVTVLRSGRVVSSGTAVPPDRSRHRSGHMRPFSCREPVGTAAIEATGLSADDRRGRPVAYRLDLAVAAGEVVGVASPDGLGALAELLLGLLPPTGGRVHVGGVDVTTAGVRERRRAGLRFIGDDTNQTGLVLQAPLWENAVLGVEVASGPGRWRREARRLSRAVMPSGMDAAAPAGVLSGGNRQRLVVKRELAGRPVAVVAAQPTLGLDNAHRDEVWDRLAELAAEGTGALLLSADAEELLACSARIVILADGRQAGEVDPRTCTKADLGARLAGARARVRAQ